MEQSADAEIKKFENYNSKNRFSLNHPDQNVQSTISEWFQHNKDQYHDTLSRGISAETVLKLSDRIKDNMSEVVMKNKKETEKRLEDRISDLREAKLELESMTEIIQNEMEVLSVLKDRTRSGIKMIKEKALNIIRKCILLRKERQGIDWSHDEVEKELEIEEKKVVAAIDILTKSLEQTEESIRLLRAALYLVNKDIDEKLRVLSIECDCLGMKETSLNLKLYQNQVPLPASNVSVEEWATYTANILSSSWKKVHAARSLQSHIYAIYKEVIEDLNQQYQSVNSAFEHRIMEVKEAKAKLEAQHYEISRQLNDITKNITELQRFIREKEAFLALAHTRMEKRACRRGIELVKDEVEATLIKEVFDIKQLIGNIQKMIAKSEVSMRILLKTQVQLEESINIKTHSIKIDEVDCMSLRQGIDYHNL